MQFKIGIDNYGLYPLNLDPMETLQWALDNKAEGVAFSGLNEEMRAKCSSEYLKRMAGFAGDYDLYLEWGGGQHIPRDMTSWEKKDTFFNNKRSAEEANALGADIIRSCSGGLMRWDPKSLSTKQLMEEMADELSLQLQMLRDHQVVLAIETHFEFTTFELLKVFEWCGVEPGDCLGICLDTMNLLTMLEDPLSATERVLPWIVSTHIKDGCILTTDHGLKTYTSPIGAGIIDLGSIAGKLKGPDRSINLSIEDHGGDFELPIYNPRFLQEFPDLTSSELVILIELAKKSEKLLEEGVWEPMPREDWPLYCEKRIVEGIEGLKKIVHG